MRRAILLATALMTALALSVPMAGAKSSHSQIDVNVVLNTDISASILSELGGYGRITETIEEIDAVFMRARLGNLDDIQALPFVAAANPDAERLGAPIDTVAAEDFSGGFGTWNLDAINVAELLGRTVPQAGSGVYVAVLDTGLVDQWRQYFPQERIAEEFGMSFGGGGGEQGNVSTQPNKWEHDTNSHGTHVTSTILGYHLGGGLAINGVAPKATVIPVKVLHNSGFGWSSMVAAGIAYIGDLKAGPLAESPVVINMSLGGPELDAVEQAAIDYAISQGVIIVASAGNSGEEGMGYPGAYEPVISAAASGWVKEWQPADPATGEFSRSWWLGPDVADPTDPNDFYITDFSSRETNPCGPVEDPATCMDLDIAAPGSWVVGPFNLQQGQTSYFFLGGTSMASPHVAGTVALMLEKNGSLTAGDAEDILQNSAIPLDPGCRDVFTVITLQVEEFCWGADATGHGLLDAAGALEMMP
ncbi:MAG TPA: S8 family serine peptidase [Acidimicrobiia bacterium]|nr:S8 family serine peptidase [Acidimicrobiia bacterium]